MPLPCSLSSEPMKMGLPHFRQHYKQRKIHSLQSLPLHTPLKTKQSVQLTLEFITRGRNIFCNRVRPRALVRRHEMSPTT